MFYLAYNMSFYDSPIVAKEFINKGISSLPMTRLPDGGMVAFVIFIIIKHSKLNGGNMLRINLKEMVNS